MPARRTSLIVESLQNLILLFGRGSREFFDTGKEFADAGLQGGKTVTVSFLVVDGESSKAAIDEVDDAGFMGAGCAIGGNDARSDGIDFGCLLRSEKGKLGSGRLDGFACMSGGGEHSGNMRGDPDGAEAGTSLGKEITATEIISHS